MIKQRYFFLIILFLYINTNLFSFSVMKLDLKELTKKAERIIKAKCKGVETRKGENDLTHTYSTFEVLEIIKGIDDFNDVIIRSLGDKDNKLYPKELHYKINDEVILFLTKKNKEGYPTVVGLHQGSYISFSDNKNKKFIKHLDGKTESVESFISLIKKYLNEKN